MPPKVTDNRSATNETLHAVEAQTAVDARRIVASFSEDFLDAVTLMCMLGIEPEGLSYARVAAEHAEDTAPKTAKRATRKKAARKAVKKATAKKTAPKKATKRTPKPATPTDDSE